MSHLQRYFLAAASLTLAYIVSQGNITATIVWFAITTGATLDVGCKIKRTLLLISFGL